MAKFFHKKKQVPQRRTSDKDLVDPVLYIGDLDPVKYPSLSQTEKDTQIETAENPLNKR